MSFSQKSNFSGSVLFPNRFKNGKQSSCMHKTIADLNSSIKAKGRDKCILPQQMSKELAEEFGIHAGDGHMSYRKYANRQSVYEYSISGNLAEIEYVQNFIKPLIKKLYNLEVKLGHKRNNEISLQYKSKSLIQFKRALGLPCGRKDEIEIPKIVLNSPYITDFVRGLFDTDGCLQFKDRNKNAPPYPRLDITGKSKKLMAQINDILLCLGFTTSLVFEERLHYKTEALCSEARVFIYGKRNLKKWMELIGFSNPKNIAKFDRWQKNNTIVW